MNSASMRSLCFTLRTDHAHLAIVLSSASAFDHMADRIAVTVDSAVTLDSWWFCGIEYLVVMVAFRFYPFGTSFPNLCDA